MWCNNATPWLNSAWAAGEQLTVMLTVPSECASCWAVAVSHGSALIATASLTIRLCDRSRDSPEFLTFPSHALIEGNAEWSRTPAPDGLRRCRLSAVAVQLVAIRTSPVATPT